MNSIDGVNLNEASRDDLRDLAIGLAHEREALKRDRDALAAHVVALIQAGERFLKHGHKCVTIGNGQVMPAADVFRATLIEEPGTSLARLIAEKQAETLRETAMKRPPGSVQRAWLLEQADEYHRQAEGKDQ